MLKIYEKLIKKKKIKIILLFEGNYSFIIEPGGKR